MGRDRYERGEEFRGYRNSYHRSRELTVGVSAVEVKAPRVSDVPAEVAGGGFESKLVRRYERTSRQRQGLFRKLYMEGLCTGDFEPVFRELVGETDALSPNAIVRLKSKWESEYQGVVQRDACRVQVRLHLGGRSAPGSGSRQGEGCAAMRGGSEGGRSEGIPGTWAGR